MLYKKLPISFSIVFGFVVSGIFILSCITKFINPVEFFTFCSDLSILIFNFDNTLFSFYLEAEEVASPVSELPVNTSAPVLPDAEIKEILPEVTEKEIISETINTEIVARRLGSGLATAGLGGVGTGIGLVFSGLIKGFSWNPSLKDDLFSYAIFGFALTEAIGLFALMMAFMLLYA